MREAGVALLAMLGLTGALAVQLPDGTPITVRQTEVATFPAGARCFPVMSADGKDVAVVVEQDGRYLWHNGTRGPRFDDLLPYFSPGGRHLICHALRGNKWVVLVDGVEQPAEVQGVDYSRDDAHVAYALEQDGKVRMRIDGVDGPLYDGVTMGAWSPSGQRCYYIAKQGDHSYLVVDGVQQQGWDDPYVFGHFSPDSAHLAVVGSREGRRYVYEDGVQKGGPYARVEAPIYSPDSKRLAYVAWYGVDRAATCAVVVDGQEGNRYREIKGLVFSPDSQHVAYKAQRADGQSCVVYDGKELAVSAGFWPTFSPDSRHFGYTDWKGSVTVGGASRPQEMVVVDGTPSRPYAAVTWLVFSPTSTRWAFTAKRLPAAPAPAAGRSGEPLVVTSEGTEYSAPHITSIYEYSLMFTLDGRHLVYEATGDETVNQGQALYIDGVRVTDYYGQLNPSLSFDRPVFTAPDTVLCYAQEYLKAADGAISQKLLRIEVVIGDGQRIH